MCTVATRMSSTCQCTDGYCMIIRWCHLPLHLWEYLGGLLYKWRSQNRRWSVRLSSSGGLHAKVQETETETLARKAEDRRDTKIEATSPWQTETCRCLMIICSLERELQCAIDNVVLYLTDLDSENVIVFVYWVIIMLWFAILWFLQIKMMQFSFIQFSFVRVNVSLPATATVYSLVLLCLPICLKQLVFARHVYCRTINSRFSSYTKLKPSFHYCFHNLSQASFSS